MKINLNKLRLKWRIFAFLLGFCALLLVILWLFQTVLLTDMYKIIRKKEMEKAVTLVEQNIESPNLQAVLENLEIDKEIIVRPTREFMPPQNPRRDDHNRPEPASITQTKDFTLQDGRVISLTFYAMISPVNATVTTLEYQLYFITGIMLLLSVLLALIIARHISKPIEEINNSAKSLSGGSYDTHFDGKGFPEIEELSDTLNTAAAELSKVEALRRELMANISHDLRTPLSLIYSYAEMMHDFPSEITAEQTQVIMNETKRLTTLVNDVLDISKLETGVQPLNTSEFNITQSIQSTVLRISELTKKDGYRLSFDYSEEVFAHADEIKITQAFYNLLINAINYAGVDKTILVRQIFVGDRIRIEVSDNGDGIAPENLPYIWDRYYKVDKNHKRAVTGTGLGLSIVKKVIELHGGNYGVKSQIGKGSTFWFDLELV